MATLLHVAIIGAGIGGVVTAAHLKTAGISVTVFERADAAGGVWIYDESPPLEPKYPADKPSRGEECSHIDAKDGDERKSINKRKHAPPSPCYEGLMNNVPTPLLRTKLNAWPEGTEDFVKHSVIVSYIQDTSRITGVEDQTIYGAAVTNVEKRGSYWKLDYRTLSENSESNSQDHTQNFDAVVVATGHYHASQIPDIPGVKRWKQKWPMRIWHSKAYRRPHDFKGKNVLLIGAGTSSADIARELGPIAKKVYQSSRNGVFDFPASILPENGVRIGEVESFSLVDEKYDEKSPLPDDEAIPSTILLKSGERLCDIHTVILCTGYHVTLPFLSQYHEDETPSTEASGTVLVTDGHMYHNPHKDTFYIPDPTLMFVGVPYFTATFTLFEFQALAVTAVLSGIATLPDRDALRQEYRERIKKKGLGKSFHSLRGVEVEYVDELLAWINKDAEKHGVPRIEGHNDTWHESKVAHMERVEMLFGGGRGASQRPVPAAILPACL